jgi:hypothetical protein
MKIAAHAWYCSDILLRGGGRISISRKVMQFEVNACDQALFVMLIDARKKVQRAMKISTV